MRYQAHHKKRNPPSSRRVRLAEFAFGALSPLSLVSETRPEIVVLHFELLDAQPELVRFAGARKVTLPPFHFFEPSRVLFPAEESRHRRSAAEHFYFLLLYQLAAILFLPVADD